ncbi:MAG: oxidoreductase [Candidatus Puniceispirillum sp. TMED52]|nr:oxidoreductase [SAR116 cluster bacterium]OUU45355.1 MAG: oxidoreductase [Candidatus Puniceispirillum sp. TMED52]
MTLGKDRIALVTGASRGIGRAAALALARKGAHIIATARTQAGLEELDDEIKANGGNATLVTMDVNDRPALPRLAEAIRERWGKLDIIVLNAGILGELTPISHMDEQIWDDVIATNLTAGFRMIHHLDPLFRQSDAGRAVLVTSGAASGRMPYWSAYAASKAGLDALGKSWAAELINTPHRVNMLSPGRIATQMIGQAFPGIDKSTLPSPDDIANAFVQLCRPDCASQGEILDATSLC